MKKALRICMGLLVVFGVTRCCAAADDLADPGKTPSDYVNSELPQWLRLSGEGRERGETLDGVSFLRDTNTYLLQRLRVNLDATPRTWLTFSFQAQDARVFFTDVSPVPSSQKDPIDLRLGYVQIGDSEESPVRLQFGRLSLSYGEGRLLADPEWSNVGRSFDAARMIFHFRKLRVDAFSGISDKININGFATPTPGEHFDGLYGSLDRVVPRASIEPYLFWKMEHNVKGEIVKTGNLDEKTIGVRWVGSVPLRLDYGMESAMQRGTLATEPISAWATHLVGGYSLPSARYLPRFYSEFNRATGSQSSTDGIHNTFDILFPSSHDKFGLSDQFGWANIEHLREGFQYRAWRSTTLGLAYNSFRLANIHDGIYNSSGKLTIASNGHQGTHIGHEPDAQFRWNPASRTQVDFSASHIFAGDFLQNTGHRGFNYGVLGVTQRF